MDTISRRERGEGNLFNNQQLSISKFGENHIRHSRKQDRRTPTGGKLLKLLWSFVDGGAANLGLGLVLGFDVDLDLLDLCLGAWCGRWGWLVLPVL